MTYKEFKELIEREHGYVVEQQDGFCTIRKDKTDATIVLINLYERHSVNTYFFTDDEDMRFMSYNWNTISEFVATPVADRFPAKKYYVKLNLPEKFSNKQQYLNKMTMSDGIIRYLWDEKKKEPSTYISPLEIGVIYQTQFTIEEIEETIPKEDMDKFKLIPVEEEE